MIHLHSFKIEHVWEHAEIPWQEAGLAAPPEGQKVWTVATHVRDQNASIVDSKFFQSVKNECDEVSKKSSLLVMLNQLRSAVYQNDYQSFIKESNVQIKEAHSFIHSRSKHKIWELKHKKKDRIYFFTHREHENGGSNYFILMLFHHKKDQKTPSSITSYCENLMKKFLDNNLKIILIGENK